MSLRAFGIEPEPEGLDADVMRFGVTPLYLGFEDVWRAVGILAEIMESEAWRAAPPRGRVT